MLRAHPALLGTLRRREPSHGTETTLHLRHPKINITCGATVIGNEALVSSDHFLVFHTSCRGHAARMINRMRKRHNFVICFCRARTVVAEAVLLSTTYASNALPDSFTCHAHVDTGPHLCHLPCAWKPVVDDRIEAPQLILQVKVLGGFHLPLTAFANFFKAWPVRSFGRVNANMFISAR